MISKWFLRFGVLFALVGMAMGIQMGVSEDFKLAPVHAHINLVGYVTMFLAGLFYRNHALSESRLAKIHLGLAILGMALLPIGIAGMITDAAWAPPVVGSGSLLTVAAMLAFTIAVFRSGEA